MLRYDPKDAVRVWDKGEYEALLMKVEEKKRQPEKDDMYVLTFQVFDGDADMMVDDYVVVPKFTWKLKRLAAAFGVEQMFENGSFDPHAYVGHNLRVELVIRKQEGYDDRNQINRYLPKDSAATNGAAKVSSAKAEGTPIEEDNDLPF